MNRIITLKLTFPHKKQYSSFDNFSLRSLPWNVEIYRFSKIANLLTKIPFKIVYILWDIHSPKNNSAVSRSSYVVKKKNSFTYAIVIF